MFIRAAMMDSMRNNSCTEISASKLLEEIRAQVSLEGSSDQRAAGSPITSHELLILSIFEKVISRPSYEHLCNESKVVKDETSLIVHSAFKLLSHLYTRSEMILPDQMLHSGQNAGSITKARNCLSLGCLIVSKLASLWGFAELNDIRRGAIDTALSILDTLRLVDATSYMNILLRILETVELLSDRIDVLPYSIDMKILPLRKLHEKALKIFLIPSDPLFGKFKDNEDISNDIIAGNICILSSGQAVTFVNAGLAVISHQYQRPSRLPPWLMSRMTRFVSGKLMEISHLQALTGIGLCLEQLIGMATDLTRSEFLPIVRYSSRIVIYSVRLLIVLAKKKLLNSSLENKYYRYFSSKLQYLYPTEALHTALSDLVNTVLLNRMKSISLKISVLNLYLPHIEKFGIPAENISDIIDIYNTENDAGLHYALIDCLKQAAKLESLSTNLTYGVRQCSHNMPGGGIIFPLRTKLSELVSIVLGRSLQDIIDNSKELYILDELSPWIDLDYSSHKNIYSVYSVIRKRMYIWIRELQDSTKNIEPLVKTAAYMSNILTKAAPSKERDTAQLEFVWVIISLLLVRSKENEIDTTFISPDSISTVIEHPELVEILSTNLDCYLCKDYDTLLACTTGLCRLYQGTLPDIISKQFLLSLITISFHRMFLSSSVTETYFTSVLKSTTECLNLVKSFVDISSQAFSELLSSLLSGFCASPHNTSAGVFAMAALRSSLCVLKHCSQTENCTPPGVKDHIISSSDKPSIVNQSLFSDKIITIAHTLKSSNTSQRLHRGFTDLIYTLLKHNCFTILEDRQILDFILENALDSVSEPNSNGYCEVVLEYIRSSSLSELEFEEKDIVDENDNIIIPYIQQCLLTWFYLQHDETRVFRLMELVSRVGELSFSSLNESFILELLVFVVKSIPSSNDERRYAALESFRRICRASLANTVKAVPLMTQLLRSLDTNLVLDIVCDQETLKFMSTCLGISAKNFAGIIINHLVPRLVVSQDEESIKRIGIINNENIPSIIISHLASIFAEMFLRYGLEFQNTLDFVMEKCGMFQLNMLLRSSLMPLITLLSAELGCTSIKNSTNALKSLHYLHEVLSTPSPDKEIKTLGSFMDRYFTGILSYVSSKIFSLESGGICVNDARKLTRSVAQMIKIMDLQLAAHSPQIMIIIDRACGLREISDLGLECISAFVEHLQDDQLSDIISELLSVICANYKRFSFKSKDHARSIIEVIFSKKSVTASTKLKNIKMFGECEAFKGLAHLSQGEYAISGGDYAERIPYIISVLNVSRSRAVVGEHIRQLKSTMENNFHILTNIYERRDLNNLAQHLHLAVKVLCKICRKFGKESEPIGLLCCECLSMVGAIDFTRITDLGSTALLEPDKNANASASDKSLDILYPLDNHEVSIRLSFHLISNIIGPAYINATDVKHQVYLAHAIQELMILCGLTKDTFYKLQDDTVDDQSPVKKHTRLSTSGDQEEEAPSSFPASPGKDDIMKMWLSMPKQLAEKIAPLVDSNFSISARAQKHTESPLFPASCSFLQWLNMWSISLIRKTSSPYARPIFHSVKHSINIMSLQAIQELLVHMCLDIIVFGKDKSVEDLMKEFCFVFRAMPGCLGDMKYTARDDPRYKLSCNTLFLIMDRLMCWTRRARKIMVASNGLHTERKKLTSLKSYCERVERFFDTIGFESAGNAAFACKSYARAIIYFETYSRKHAHRDTRDIKDIYSKLLQVYSAVKEEDYAQGLCKRINDMTLEQEALRYETSKDWSSAQMCFENMMKVNERDLFPHGGIMRCFKNTGQFNIMLAYCRGCIAGLPSEVPDIGSFAAEAAWRLGEWDILQSSIDRCESPETFEKKLSRLLLSIYKNDHSHVSISDPKALLHSLKRSMVEEVCSMMEETPYTHLNTGYETMCRLHAVYSIESVINLNEEHITKDLMESKVSMWSQRLRSITPSFYNRELNLYLNKSLLTILRKRLLEEGKLSDSDIRDIDTMEGGLWLDISKTARKSGYYQTALSAILHAQSFKIPEAQIERAKLMWAQAKNYDAISILESYVVDADHIAGDKPVQTSDERIRDIKTKALLHLTYWKEITGSGRSESIIASYSRIEDQAPNWDRALFYLGRYYNKLYQNHHSKKKHDEKSSVALIRLARLVCSQYSKVISLGDKYYYETMPRLLTLWLDHGDGLPLLQKDAESSHYSAEFRSLNKTIIDLNAELPEYKFLHAIPQLVSRIGHTNHDVYPVILDIITSVLLCYPEQVLWGLIATYRSSSKERADRMKRVFDMAIGKSRKKRRDGSLTTVIIEQTIRVSDMLVKLCNMNVKASLSSIDLKTLFPTLSTTESLQITMPLQLSIYGDSSNASVFIPNTSIQDSPTIVSFYPRVNIVSSLQRPKKLRILGSDGNVYTFLCKPKDDLRRDYWLMGLSSMVTRILMKDSESRKRNLFIKTYAVTPLDDECGLIEWIPDTIAFRKIVLDCYKTMNVYTSQAQVMDLLNNKTCTLEENFTNLLSRYYCFRC